MKKLSPLLYVVISLFALAVSIQAHPLYSPATDPEKIYLFDSQITANADGAIQVVENITINAKHEKINHGIFRDIPLLKGERITPIRLELDGKKHPFSMKSKGNTKRFYFGSSDYLIPKGIHTYTFAYTFTGAFRFRKNYDEMYWNVTGNDWIFPIDKAQVQVIFPEDAHVVENGISVYTGKTGAKDHNAKQTGNLTFETTQPLDIQEGLTILIPLDKGFLQHPSLASSLNFSWPLLLSLFLTICLFYYFIVTWLKVGKDPSYKIAVTQYTPPEGISPAFMNYLCATSGTAPAENSRKLACALLDMAMKGILDIKYKRQSLFFAGAELTLKGSIDKYLLPKEERIILNHLFPDGKTSFFINLKVTNILQNLLADLERLFQQNAKDYFVSNTAYLKNLWLPLTILGILPCFLLPSLFFSQDHPLILVNLLCGVGLCWSTASINHIGTKIGWGLIPTLMCIAFWVDDLDVISVEAPICQSLFLLSCWGFVFYSCFIRNVTPQGKDLFTHIYGFKKYLEVAEDNRIAASDPTDAEKVFCDFLPFAFALGLENIWMLKFGKLLSQATINRCTDCAGGPVFISHGLVSAIAHSSSSRDSGGSGGGGCSGGGSGGGGGGGW